MRYEGIGMGGPGSVITLIFILLLIGLFILHLFDRKFPKFTESLIETTVTLAVNSFWLVIFILVVVAVSIPVSGIFNLDREEQLISWPFIGIALYMVGKRLK